MTLDFLFIVLPYLAVALAVVVSLYRYLNNRFSYSSLSSQFLESSRLFWGSLSWHYGILLILLAHLLAVLFPAAWGRLLGEPARLYVLEVSGLALGCLTVAGIALFAVRRLASPRLQAITSPLDWVLLALLLLQVATGVYTAWAYRWGGAWYVHTAVPYLRSLLLLRPQVEYVATLPLIAKLHIWNAWALVALLPFTRLVHVLSLPVGYLWRPYQLAVWHRRPAGTGERA